ncbi:hypothetical protein IAT38_004644 [Cryptococcus sp. DSM 104549]
MEEFSSFEQLLQLKGSASNDPNSLKPTLPPYFVLAARRLLEIHQKGFGQEYWRVWHLAVPDQSKKPWYCWPGKDGEFPIPRDDIIPSQEKDLGGQVHLGSSSEETSESSSEEIIDIPSENDSMTAAPATTLTPSPNLSPIDKPAQADQPIPLWKSALSIFGVSSGGSGGTMRHRVAPRTNSFDETE